MQAKVLSAPPMSSMDKRTTKHIPYFSGTERKEKEQKEQKEQKEHGETIKGPPSGRGLIIGSVFHV